MLEPLHGLSDAKVPDVRQRFSNPIENDRALPFLPQGL
jgi:hypothetical protein